MHSYYTVDGVQQPTGRVVFGNQSESLLGPNLFKSKPIGGIGMTIDVYHFMAFPKAGQWSKAYPDGRYEKNIGNVTLDHKGDIGLTNKYLYGSSENKIFNYENSNGKKNE